MSEMLRVLVVDDDYRSSKTLTDILRIKGYEAEAAQSGTEALRKAEERHFDCVLTDIRMPGVNGVELCRGIKAKQPDMPVVLMTAYSTDRLVQEGLEEGAIAALIKPLNIDALFMFFSLLRKERSVVIVDDDPAFAKTLGNVLRIRGFLVTHFTEPHDLVEGVKANGLVILLDMMLDDINGLEVFREIRRRDVRVPVVLVTGYREEMAQAVQAALRLCAHTCLYKPFQIEELLQVMDEIRRSELRRILLQ